MKANGEAPLIKRRCISWKKRTSLERYLIVLCVTTLVAFVCLAATVLYLEHIYTRPKPGICRTNKCRRIAGRIMSLMDFDVDPCEDFYNFSCGSFPKVMPAPGTVNKYNFYYIVRERMSKISNDLLETEEEDEPDFIKKTKLFYKACLNLDSETSAIIGQLVNISGFNRWPILDDDVSKEDQLVEKAWALTKVNGVQEIFFLMYLETNYTEHEIQLFRGSVFGDEEMFLNDTDELWIRRKKKYRSLLTHSFFKAGMPVGSVESEVDGLIQFETLFANITSNYRRENSMNTTLKELSEECKKIHLKEIVEYIFNYLGHLDDFYDEMPVYISSKVYFDEMCKLFNISSRRVIYNYLMWRFVAEELRKIDHQFEKIYQEVTDGEMPQPLSKSRKCIKSFENTIFIHGLNYMVINHLNPQKSIEEISEFDVQIREVMDHMFSVQTWLEDKDKELARDRLSNISSAIGYSKASLDVGLLEKVFSQVKVSENHIENCLNEERRERRKAVFNDTEDIILDNDIKVRHPLNSYAYFAETYYVLQLGFIQPPFYEYGAPKYINFALMPVVIAHEFLHGYDSVDWEHQFQAKEIDIERKWSREVAERFKKRKECLMSQYSRYPLDGKGTMVNGNRTIKDNIADNGGMQHAFRAYEKYYLSKEEEPGLPGLNYSNAQLFFIAFAQTFCETLRDPVKAYRHDGHSPRRFRVIGTLQNLAGFSEVFKCPIGSRMNPRKKCRVWG